MARNKHPEETVQKILDVSFQLFLAQGYENTTIQDIVDALGMSKGAIYHHFKSKEEIVDRLCGAFYDDWSWYEEIRSDPSLTGLEKLRRVFRFQLSDRNKLNVDRISVGLLENPKMLVGMLRSSVEDGAPMIAALIEEGNRDGSLHVSQPREAAECLLILSNLWVGGLSRGREDFLQKARFLREMTEQLGLPILDDELLEICGNYFDQVVSMR